MLIIYSKYVIFFLLLKLYIINMKIIYRIVNIFKINVIYIHIKLFIKII